MKHDTFVIKLMLEKCVFLVLKDTIRLEGFFNYVTIKRKRFQNASTKVDFPIQSKGIWGFCAHGLKRLKLEYIICVDVRIIVTYPLKNIFVLFQENAS